ncbi:hypothetical protein JVU11DRAFT_6088 [Chiua virens]|nr:hypothetical protein JVU11DRAFT_6088 [Chiua virens]
MTFDPYVTERFSTASTPHSLKSEPSSSPHTPPHAFSFTYPLPDKHDHIPYHPMPHDRPVFRFGTTHPSDVWSFKRHQHDPAHTQAIPLDINALSFPDDYEDADELADLPPSSGTSSHATLSERIIRRRSSKGKLLLSPFHPLPHLLPACDQCRKSKCKCERTVDGDACKNCIMLGTPCTFLGPSRKRGPPKGYIDAIEARLHQTEALLGILLAVEAERAESDNTNSSGKHDLESPDKEDSLERILGILRKDTLAREILNRVDATPYGVKGRKTGGVKARPHAQAQENSGSSVDLHSTHPSNEWQDRVASLLASSLPSQPYPRPIRPSPPFAPTSNTISLSEPPTVRSLQNPHPAIHISHHDGDLIRRQRRRVDDDDADDRSTSPRGIILTRNGSISPGYSPAHTNAGYASGSGYASGYMGASTDSDSEDDVIDAVGQLSINEDEQVRYHGKASGLYLLGFNAKTEPRNEGGIWRFPKARVWPPLPPSAENELIPSSMPISPLGRTAPSKLPTVSNTGHAPLASPAVEGDLTQLLPDPTMQEHLLELYFTYVHAGFPIIHKEAFWEGYRNMQNPTDTPSPSSDQAHGNSPAPLPRKRRHIPPLLLLSMFSIAARYSPSSSPPPSRGSTPVSPHPPQPTPMWTAGDDFLLLAKNLLDNTYASSLPSTVQSLLLLGYREIGIGAMAQAWAYTGMAVRMAQDLGMHRAADGWARVGVGRLFGSRELQERRRIWWGCVMLDSYVSTYIGRPLAIFEGDYDTQPPSVEERESDEQGTWAPHPSLPPDTEGHGYRPGFEMLPPVPGRILSCFTASAKLSTILSKIVQSIYSIRPSSSRQVESISLEGSLDKWYFDLPEHLRFEMRYDPMGNLDSKKVPPPHILTLHMQYWCTILLLHRPLKSENGDEAEVRAASKKNYELCVGAANHIASIVTFYREKYCLQRAPVFLCFYVFTAGIMHVTSLSVYENDPQARTGLVKCMDALHDMEAVWPSAARAHELLRGCDPLNKNAPKEGRYGQLVTHQSGLDRPKRAAEHAADLEDAYERSQMRVPSSGGSLGSSQPYAQTWRSTQYAPVAQNGGPGQGDFSPSTTGHSSYYPWPSDGGSYAPFPGTLSTSVLPQMYSTGLIDDRRLPPSLTSSQHGHARLNGHSSAGGVGHGGFESTNGGGRYPQYWNDYTSFPQMGMTYGQAAGAATATAQEGMYVSEQYGVYEHAHSHPPAS